MTRDEAAEALTLMQAAWPRWCTDDVSVRLWLGYLERVDVATARDAIDQLITTRPYPPAVADWQDCCRAIQVRRQEDRKALPEHRPDEFTEHGRLMLDEAKKLARTLRYKGSRMDTG